MSIETILRWILAAAVVLALGTIAVARASSGRKGVQTFLGIATALWAIGCIGASVAFASKIGPVIVAEGVFLALGPAFALAAGTRSETQSASAARVRVTVALLLLACDLGGFYSLNHRIVELADSLGFGKPHGVVAPTADKDCPDNLKSLYFAIEKYAESNGALPLADKWMDNEEITSRVQKDEWFHCPAVSNRHDANFGYAFNDAVAGKMLDGKKLSEMPGAATTPLLYDSSTLSKSAHDAFKSLPRPGRHGGKNSVLYCDGHIEQLAAAP